MSATVHITVPGNPRAKGRPRFGRGNVYTPQGTVEHEKVVWAHARKAHVGPPLEGPLRVDIAFHLSTARRADCDNLQKLVWDSLNGLLWEDDSQIVSAVVTKHIDRENPRTEIEIRQLHQAAA